MEEEKLVLEYFFTNTDRPIFALKTIPAALQGYVYMGVSRFPDLRQRFLKILRDTGAFEKVVKAIKQGTPIEDALKPALEFSAEKNKDVFFNYGHKSAGEGASIFFVSEHNPIYATEIQQDFFFPMTTMELSTRYSKKFTIDRVYWDKELMKTEFAAEAKETIKRNLARYENGFEILLKSFKEKNAKEELSEKVSVLDSLRFLIPIATYTTVILGGNVRSVLDHFKKLLSYKDCFVEEYAKECIAEGTKLFPEYFQGLEANKGVIKREKKIGGYAEKLFEKKFSPVKENVKMFFELPTEELALTQILYPHCNVTFEEVFEKVESMKKSERKEIFGLVTEDRQNRENPSRGFAVRPIVFEVESAWAMWKDFKRNRLNLRFQQPMRGKAGFETSELIKGSELEKPYAEAMQKTSDLIEKVFEKHGGVLSKTVAAQGSKKRFLMCMDPRQLTVLTELRTCGEGDKGYRRIASRMIELAKEKNSGLFGHIQDNYKKTN